MEMNATRAKLVRTASVSGIYSRSQTLPDSANIVAKLFFASALAMMIQDKSPIRYVDSRICAPRLHCCTRAAPRRVLQHNLPLAEMASPFDHPVGCWRTVWRYFE